MSGEEAGKGIAFDNYTAQRVWFHNGPTAPTRAATSRSRTPDPADLPTALAATAAAPTPTASSRTAAGTTCRHNTIRNPYEQTSAILMSTNTSPISNVVIDHNLMSGGGYTVYCGTDEGGMTPNRPTRTTSSPGSSSRRAATGARPRGAIAPRGRATTCSTATTCRRRAPCCRAARHRRQRRERAAARPSAQGPRQAQEPTRHCAARSGGAWSGPRAGCTRSASAAPGGRVACRVSWRQGKKGHAKRRFHGKVVLRPRHAPIASLRGCVVHRWSRSCDCGRVIKRSGTV